MKKNTLIIFCIGAFLLSVLGQAQCLTAAAGVSPNYEITIQNCNGQYYEIPGAAQASQYSLVNVTVNNWYYFQSSRAGDRITIGDENGTVVLGWSSNPGLKWRAPYTGIIRFYTHYNSVCGVGGSTTRVKSVACVIPSNNDSCGNAITLDTTSQNYQDTGSTIGATTNSSLQTFSCQPNSANDVWFKATVPSSGNLTVFTGAVAGSNLNDTVLNVYSGNCNGLTQIACNDDISTTNYFSQVVLTGLTSGSQIYIAVSRYSVNTSDGLFIIGTIVGPEANDECSGAITLVPGVETVASNFGATDTTDPLFVNSYNCVGFAAYEVWFKTVASPQGDITVTTSHWGWSDVYNTAMVMYYGTACSNIYPIACDADILFEGGPNDNRFSEISYSNLPPNAPIWISVWKQTDFIASGNFNILVSHSQLSNITFDSENFKSYPNPVKDILNLSYDKTISNVSIYNLVGQEIITKSINATQSQIDMSHLASGTYLVKVTADNQMKTIKVIKE